MAKEIELGFSLALPDNSKVSLDEVVNHVSRFLKGKGFITDFITNNIARYHKEIDSPKIRGEYGSNPRYDIEIYRDNIFLQIKPGAFNPQMIVFSGDNSPVKLQMDLIEKLSKELIIKFQLEEKYKCLDLKYV